MGVKLIHTADIHLKRDEPFRLGVLSWIISQAKKLADGLLIAGDLFETDTEASFLRGKVRDMFERVRPLPVLIVPGNHDCSSYSSQTHYGDNVRVFFTHPSQVEIKGINIAGVPFRPDVEFSRCMEQLECGKMPDIVVAHGTLYDQKSSQVYTDLGEDARYMPIYRWQIEKRTRYLALGHYHSKFTRVDFGGTEVVYPGSPVATDRGSLGERFLALVEIEDRGVTVQKLPVESVPYWQRVEWMVFPGKEKQKLNEIESELGKSVQERVMLQGVIKGSIGMSEAKFQEQVAEIEGRYGSNFKEVHLSCEVKHWTQVIQDPTVALFMEKLGEKDCDEVLKERALELVLSALERVRG